MKGREIVNAFEQSDVILTYRYPELDVPLWPFVRFLFLDFFSAKINSLGSTNTGSSNHKAYSLLRSFITSLYKNPYLIRSRDVLFFNTGVTNVKLENGKYFNRVTDYYYFLIPTKAALIEDLHNHKIVSPRVHDEVYSFLPLKVNSLVNSLLRKKEFLVETQNEIKLLIGYLSSVSPVSLDDCFWRECEFLFVRQISKASAQYATHKNFLLQKRPKLIFLEDASYGTKLPLLLASKDLNIPVVELQHGLINENHLAYQFGESVVNNLKPYLPDYFLSYSDYWSNSVNLPSVKVEIGNPYLDEYLKKHPKRTEKKVLILGTGTSKDQLITFCKYLRYNTSLEGYKFVLRPHPWERAEAAEKYKDLLNIGYEIDLKENIYQSLSVSAFVFGEMSTAIFEASVYDIPVYLIATEHCKTNLTDSTPFPLIKIGPEVSNIDFQSPQESIHLSIWAANWNSNFLQFLTRLIDL